LGFDEVISIKFKVLNFTICRFWYHCWLMRRTTNSGQLSSLKMLEDMCTL